MKISPCAKINLGLNIVNRRSDGYHDLETVFYPIRICDEIEITESDGPAGFCSLIVDGVAVECSVENNLVVRAYNLIAGKYHIPHADIRLYKHIPMQAGMGGGSSDCAYTIRLLNDVFKLGMSIDLMRQYAAQLGADCAFFITSQPAYAEGIGDRLYPVDLNLSPYRIVVVKPPVSVSTKEAFAGITVSRPEKCCREIIAQPIETWRRELYNDFETSIFPQYPVLAEIKEKLYSEGAIYAAMSGSGSAIFGIFRQVPDVETFKEYGETYIV